ncbi:hypothetical protein [Desulfovibrio gilichinskyi]|uniref:Uncharacterized protein n=1 Tax=Desulfovibrio gilichinskyi TaxID=1519643 RepID=A0A1X7C0T5_9BACT|nr:hypothetical protein [Desulfovibrio gilichinskyi]SME87850.1 hypothetical protein SAMN06295933_0060 [Desulfovibrio gilichinskyi]
MKSSQHFSVDVCVNVLGKPYQTALSILSLLKYSATHISKIYIILEKNNKASHVKQIKSLLDHLKVDIVYYTPKNWYWVYPLDRRGFKQEDIRDGLRYQFAFENSDSKLIYVMHNDVVHYTDVLQIYHSAIKGHIAVGNIGMCHNCPAFWSKKCSKDKYMSYQPRIDELRKIYNEADPPSGWKGFMYHLEDFCEEFRENPWPLPCCRVNEFSCLIDLDKYRSTTTPYGDCHPFGAYGSCGGYLLDIGCNWFHDVHLRGFTCKNITLSQSEFIHIGGHSAMFSKDLYFQNELRAYQELKSHFNINILDHDFE